MNTNDVEKFINEFELDFLAKLRELRKMIRAVHNNNAQASSLANHIIHAQKQTISELHNEISCLQYEVLSEQCKNAQLTEKVSLIEG